MMKLQLPPKLICLLLLTLAVSRLQASADQLPDSTLLPLVIIDTRGQAIPDEPRIVADMGIVQNEGYNRPTDPRNAYKGQISIEMRGESSQYFYEKKSFSIETQLADGSNNNVSLLGLPEENDWVLYAPFGDKSLLRNVITYRLFEAMGRYAPRTRFVELILNGDYQGLYVLTEKIKRDKDRVAIKKLDPTDYETPGITGGYLLRVDKLSKMPDAAWWESPVAPPVSGFSSTVFQYFDPEYDELIPVQKAYIQDYLTDFESAFAGPDFTDPKEGYRRYLDIPSFVDLMILNEIAKDVDGFRLSHYFYKQNSSNGGKLVQGPPWDYNLTYGNSDYSPDIHETYNWTHTYQNTIFWWVRAMQDPWFRNQLHCRWDALYADAMSKEKVGLMIDSIRAPLDGAIERNFARWPILGIYVWPNYYVGQTHALEEAWLRTWIDQRLDWIDDAWGGRCTTLSERGNAQIAAPASLHIYPNPSDLSRTSFTLPAENESALTLRVSDLRGHHIYEGRHTRPAGGTFQLPDLSALPPGIYLLDIRLPSGKSYSGKLIRD